MRFALVLFATLATVLPSRAQDPAVALPDSIVVTASRGSEAARTTGRRVVVLTARDIAALPVASFDELLRTVAGVEVQSRGGFGIQSDLTIRGSSFNGVLVLLDGARFNDPMTGHFLADFPVPLSEIARVEVLRGPAAAVYGPDALGGVVHLFTHDGIRASVGALDGRMEGIARVEIGDHGWFGATGAARATFGEARVSTAHVFQSTDGEAIVDAEGAPIVASTGAIRTDVRRSAHTAAAVLPLGRAHLFARLGYDDRDFGAYRYYTVFPSDTAREATSTLWGQLRVTSSPGAATQVSAHLSARVHTDRYVYNPQTRANEHTSDLVTATVEVSRAASRNWTVAGGAEAHARRIDSNNLGTHGDAGGGGFIRVRAEAAPGVMLGVSARLDYDPGYGVEATPHVTAAWTRAHYGFRAAAGRAVRAPNYIERYFNTTLADPRGRDVGNPDLRPESSWSAEAGVDLYPTLGVSVHATAFHRVTDDLIDFVRLTPDASFFYARNVLEVANRGLEIEARAERALGRARIGLDASWTGLDAELSGRIPDATYKYTLTHARHLVQGTARVRFAGIVTSVRGVWKDRLEGDSYGVVDMRLAATHSTGSGRFTASLALRNALDVQYTEVLGAPLPGRWWTAALMWRR